MSARKKKPSAASKKPRSPPKNQGQGKARRPKNAKPETKSEPTARKRSSAGRSITIQVIHHHYTGKGKKIMADQALQMDPVDRRQEDEITILAEADGDLAGVLRDLCLKVAEIEARGQGHAELKSVVDELKKAHDERTEAAEAEAAAEQKRQADWEAGRAERERQVAEDEQKRAAGKEESAGKLAEMQRKVAEAKAARDKMMGKPTAPDAKAETPPPPDGRALPADVPPAPKPPDQPAKK